MTTGAEAAGGGAAKAAGGAWMMTLLTSAFALNLLDRQIVNVLAEPIKRDLALADWQLGALTGLSFALLYSVAALPIARLADRGDRVRIVGLAILAWSAFTAACGAAGSFLQLLLLRIGVGVGEAGCAPPSQALISDRYPPETRSSALGKFALGSPVGAAIGLAAGGVLAEQVGWRWTMVIAGAPGLLIGLLVLTTLRDPRRDLSVSERPVQPPMRQVLGGFMRRPAFIFLALGSALLSFVHYSAMAFAGSYYLRVHSAEVATLGERFGVGALGVIGLGLGLFGAGAGAAGTYVGGHLGDRLGRRDVRALALIPAVGSLLTVLAYWAMFTAPSAALSLALFVLPSFLGNLWNGPGALALQNLAGPHAKATAMALVLFVVSAIGLGLGPLSVGLLSDALAARFGEGRGLQIAILAGVSIGLLSAASHALASRTLRRDLEVAAA